MRKLVLGFGLLVSFNSFAIVINQTYGALATCSGGKMTISGGKVYCVALNTGLSGSCPIGETTTCMYTMNATMQNALAPASTSFSDTTTTTTTTTTAPTRSTTISYTGATLAAPALPALPAF